MVPLDLGHFRKNQAIWQYSINLSFIKWWRKQNRRHSNSNIALFECRQSLDIDDSNAAKAVVAVVPPMACLLSLLPLLLPRLV